MMSNASYGRMFIYGRGRPQRRGHGRGYSLIGSIRHRPRNSSVLIRDIETCFYLSMLSSILWSIKSQSMSPRSCNQRRMSLRERGRGGGEREHAGLSFIPWAPWTIRQVYWWVTEVSVLFSKGCDWHCECVFLLSLSGVSQCHSRIDLTWFYE